VLRLHLCAGSAGGAGLRPSRTSRTIAWPSRRGPRIEVELVAVDAQAVRADQMDAHVAERSSLNHTARPAGAAEQWAATVEQDLDRQVERRGSIGVPSRPRSARRRDRGRRGCAGSPRRWSLSKSIAALVAGGRGCPCRRAVTRPASRSRERGAVARVEVAHGEASPAMLDLGRAGATRRRLAR